LSKSLFSKALKEYFGQYIRQLREERKLPLRKLAAFIDVDQSTLSKFERGDRLPKEEVLPKLAEFFKIDLEDLRIQYLSDKVVYPILEENHAKEILEVAEAKLKYHQSKQFKQGTLFDS
jgi:HTH-type transcriptional regulator, competence development regulator